MTAISSIRAFFVPALRFLGMLVSIQVCWLGDALAGEITFHSQLAGSDVVVGGSFRFVMTDFQ